MLGVAVIMSIMVMASPVSPALAAGESIELDPEDGAVGDTVDITGESFDASGDLEEDFEYVDMYFSADEADEGDEIDSEVENYEQVKSGFKVDEDGELDTSFKVPSKLTDGDSDETVTGGTYYVYVTYEEDSEIVAMAEFTIASPEIKLDPDEGPVGTEVEISGSGFSDSETLTIDVGTTEVDIESGDDETDSSGEFECTIIVPEAANGNRTITVTDESGAEGKLDFTVESEIEVSPTTIPSATTSVTVSGTGFAATSEVTIWIDEEEAKTDTTNSRGSFDISFTVPASIIAQGSRSATLEVNDEDGNSGETTVTIVYTAPTTPPPTTPTTPTTPTMPTTPTTPTIPTTPPSSGLMGGVPIWAIIVGAAIVVLIIVLVVYMLVRR
jgi:hypothetical protein